VEVNLHDDAKPSGVALNDNNNISYSSTGLSIPGEKFQNWENSKQRIDHLLLIINHLLYGTGFVIAIIPWTTILYPEPL